MENNVKCKSYIGRICLSHIQQEFQAVKIDWLAHGFWKWLNKGYIFKNTVSMLAAITSTKGYLCRLQKYGKYCSKYYVFKASIKEQNITIKNVFKIQILNNLGPKFKTYLIVVENQI